LSIFVIFQKIAGHEFLDKENGSAEHGMHFAPRVHKCPKLICLKFGHFGQMSKMIKCPYRTATILVYRIESVKIIKMLVYGMVDRMCIFPAISDYSKRCLDEITLMAALCIQYSLTLAEQ